VIAVVMAGLVPAIHALFPALPHKDVDARAKRGHDGSQNPRDSARRHRAQSRSHKGS